jgi:WS/DGAT/MGAT family acyltransferase
VNASGDRLSAAEAMLLYRESPSTSMHGGTVAILDGADAPDFARICDLVSARIVAAPRYRQRVRSVPGRLANPVWVDDEQFDIHYHVRRSALPKPGTVEQLWELVGRVQSRQLDRHRPLWELYVVEGLQDGRFALMTKIHHALAVSAAGDGGDVLTMLLDAQAAPVSARAARWQPPREPSPLDLVVKAVSDNLRRPTQVVETVRADVADVRAVAARIADAAGEAVGAAASVLRPAPRSPLSVRVGEQRRFAAAALDLDDHRRVRKAYGGSVNDVVLATVAGALRIWLLTRGEKVTPATTLRAMVPVSVNGSGEAAGIGNGAAAPADPSRLRALFVDLPVGEASPAVRLHRVAYATKAHSESGESVGAAVLSSLSGFAAPTIHAAAARLTTRMTKRLFNLVVANVPGPQHALHLGEARMLQAYPVVPLAEDRALSVGVTSYHGGVYYGLVVDRDAMPDVDVLAQCLDESLAELVETVR